MNDNGIQNRNRYLMNKNFVVKFLIKQVKRRCRLVIIWAWIQFDNQTRDVLITEKVFGVKNALKWWKWLRPQTYCWYYYFRWTKVLFISMFFEHENFANMENKSYLMLYSHETFFCRISWTTWNYIMWILEWKPLFRSCNLAKYKRF